MHPRRSEPLQIGFILHTGSVPFPLGDAPRSPKGTMSTGRPSPPHCRYPQGASRTQTVMSNNTTGCCVMPKLVVSKIQTYKEESWAILLMFLYHTNVFAKASAQSNLPFLQLTSCKSQFNIVFWNAKVLLLPGGSRTSGLQ
jgi:hypothetical protein